MVWLSVLYPLTLVSVFGGPALRAGQERPDRADSWAPCRTCPRLSQSVFKRLPPHDLHQYNRPNTTQPPTDVMARRTVMALRAVPRTRSFLSPPSPPREYECGNKDKVRERGRQNCDARVIDRCVPGKRADIQTSQMIRSSLDQHAEKSGNQPVARRAVERQAVREQDRRVLRVKDLGKYRWKLIHHDSAWPGSGFLRIARIIDLQRVAEPGCRETGSVESICPRYVDPDVVRINLIGSFPAGSADKSIELCRRKIVQRQGVPGGMETDKNGRLRRWNLDVATMPSRSVVGGDLPVELDSVRLSESDYRPQCQGNNQNGMFITQTFHPHKLTIGS